MTKRRKSPKAPTWHAVATAETERFLAETAAIQKKTKNEVNKRLSELQEEADKETAEALRNQQYEYSASRGALSNVDIWEEHKAAVDLAETFGDFKTLSEPPVALLTNDGRRGIAHLAKDQTKDGIGAYLRQAAKLWNAKITTFVRGKISGSKAPPFDTYPDPRPQLRSTGLRSFLKDMGESRAKARAKK